MRLVPRFEPTTGRVVRNGSLSPRGATTLAVDRAWRRFSPLEGVGGCGGKKGDKQKDLPYLGIPPLKIKHLLRSNPLNIQILTLWIGRSLGATSGGGGPRARKLGRSTSRCRGPTATCPSRPARCWRSGTIQFARAFPHREPPQRILHNHGLRDSTGLASFSPTLTLRALRRIPSEQEAPPKKNLGLIASAPSQERSASAPVTAPPSACPSPPETFRPTPGTDQPPPRRKVIALSEAAVLAKRLSFKL